MGKPVGPPAHHLLALLLVLCSGGWLGPGRAAEPERPAPPASRVRYFDSDPAACRPERIRAAYKGHLLPYADQSPAVLARLRVLQNDITLASLRRCVQKGLLTRPQASELFRELGLTVPDLPPAESGGAPAGATQPTAPAAGAAGTAP